MENVEGLFSDYESKRRYVNPDILLKWRNPFFEKSLFDKKRGGKMEFWISLGHPHFSIL
jgi:hypothetical protein